jgi:hypothetical protein
MGSFGDPEGRGLGGGIKVSYDGFSLELLLK